MSEQISQQYVNFTFLKKLFFNNKINMALKDCKKIESYLLSSGLLSKFDTKLNLVTSDGLNNEVKNSYFLYKIHSKDGSIQPLKKYTILNSEILPTSDAIIQDILILDLYEKSIYLHSYFKYECYTTGYLIKEEIKSEKNKTLIFSNEKVKISTKDINKCDTISVVDDFINYYIV